MQLIDLLNKANEGYPDGCMAQYYDPETGEPRDWKAGDTLAWFITNQIHDAYDETNGFSNKEIIAEIVKSLDMAIGDIKAVKTALTEADKWRWCGELKPIEAEGGMFCPHKQDEYGCFECPHYWDMRTS